MFLIMLQLRQGSIEGQNFVIDMCVHKLINRVCDLIHMCLTDQQNMAMLGCITEMTTLIICVILRVVMINKTIGEY